MVITAMVIFGPTVHWAFSRSWPFPVQGTTLPVSPGLAAACGAISNLPTLLVLRLSLPQSRPADDQSTWLCRPSVKGGPLPGSGRRVRQCWADGLPRTGMEFPECSLSLPKEKGCPRAWEASLAWATQSGHPEPTQCLGLLGRAGMRPLSVQQTELQGCPSAS